MNDDIQNWFENHTHAYVSIPVHEDLAWKISIYILPILMH